MKKLIGIVLSIVVAVGFIWVFILAKNNNVKAVGANMLYLLILLVLAIVTIGGLHLIWRRKAST